MPKRNLSNWKMIKISFSSFLEQKKDVSFALNRVPPPHLPTSPFMSTPLPPPQGRRLLWMVPYLPIPPSPLNYPSLL